jgi:hypothetical protein
MTTSLLNQLPAIYAHLLPPVFSAPIPQESYANCRSCHMCEPSPVPSTHIPFSVASKCCTFPPIIPNYLVGAYLADDPSRTLDDVSMPGRHVTPLGAFPNAESLIQYTRILPDGFGRDSSTICPFYQNGDCGVWGYRNAICSTYQCKHVKGIRGKRFWEAVRDFLQCIEGLLADYCAHDLGISPTYLTHASVDFFVTSQLAVAHGTMAPPTDDDWGDWSPKKADFYRACAQRVRTLSAEALAGFGPHRYAITHANLMDAYTDMTTPTLPLYLKKNPRVTHIPFDDTASFFQIDYLLKMPAVVWPLLDYFDGATPVDRALSRANADLGICVETDYIQHLFEQQLLVPLLNG